MGEEKNQKEFPVIEKLWGGLPSSLAPGRPLEKKIKG